ncbi:hypothetical protein PRIPAC_96554, partial [Pristionchus pacificus]
RARYSNTVSRRFTDDRDRRSGRFSPNERAFRQRRGNGHSTESRRLRGCNENYFEKRSENGKKVARRWRDWYESYQGYSEEKSSFGSRSYRREGRRSGKVKRFRRCPP